MNLKVIEIIIYKFKSVECPSCNTNTNKTYKIESELESNLPFYCESCAKFNYGAEIINKGKIDLKPITNRDRIIKEKRKW